MDDGRSGTDGARAAGEPPHVVIIGGGFGGLTAAQSLAQARVRVTLIDRANHHLFQPLLYQVAMAGLSPAEIAMPIRQILSRQPNVRVLLGDVFQVDLARRVVRFHDDVIMPISYDFLIIAAGAETSYFGHPEWEEFAIGLKTLDDALEIRRRVLVAFEAAERETSPERRRELLTFVVIGGGPTGVELAGALAELSRYVLARDFRSIDPSATRVLLLEGVPRILGTFTPELSARAVAQLEGLGVEVRTNAKVTNIDEAGVHLGAELVRASTVIWAAGVKAAPLAANLSAGVPPVDGSERPLPGVRPAGVAIDRAGRILVEPDCSIPGHPEAFAVGDIAHLESDGVPLPGISPVAMQEARAVATNIERTLAGQPREPFRYVDKGTMATIGRSRAIAQVGRVALSGFLAWLAWLLVHIWYLIGFKNRIFVLLDWAWSYVTYKRGARLITGGVLSPQEARLRHAAEKRELLAEHAEAHRQAAPQEVR